MDAGTGPRTAGGAGCGQVNVASQAIVPMGQAPIPAGHFSCTVSRGRPVSTVTHSPSYNGMTTVNVAYAVMGASGVAPAATGCICQPPAGAAGSEIFPAWPISCCSNSVALRTLVCISVRFTIVPWVFVIWTNPDKMTAETP